MEQQKADSTETGDVPRSTGGRRTTLHDEAQASQMDTNVDPSEKSGNSKAYEITQEDK